MSYVLLSQPSLVIKASLFSYVFLCYTLLYYITHISHSSSALMKDESNNSLRAQTCTCRNASKMFIYQNISDKFHPGPVISPEIGFKPGLHFLVCIIRNRVGLTSNYKVTFNCSHGPSSLKPLLN